MNSLTNRNSNYSVISESLPAIVDIASAIRRHITVARITSSALLAALLCLGAGCGSATVRHVPKFGAISGSKMSNLRGSQPIHVKAGEADPAEVKIGTVGLGKVMGKLSEWTVVAVGAVQTNLASRGATLSGEAPKALTITMTKAEVKAVPFAGAKSKVVLTASTPDGLNSTFEASNSSLAPLGAVNGAVEDAVKKLLADSAIDAYLRK